jgi:hypothetical protein
VPTRGEASAHATSPTASERSAGDPGSRAPSAAVPASRRKSYARIVADDVSPMRESKSSARRAPVQAVS